MCVRLTVPAATKKKIHRNPAVAGIVIAHKPMFAFLSKLRKGTFGTILAGVLYVITLPAVRNWLMGLLTGKSRTDQKVIDVNAKKE
jgi:hypothetical protein